MSGTSDLKKWLFTVKDDIRGNTFAKAALNEDFSSINDPDCECLEGQLLKHLMTVRDYRNKPSNEARDHDVHHEFTNFIIETGLFHKAIDKSTLVGTKLANVEAVIRKVFGASITKDRIRDNVNNIVEALRARSGAEPVKLPLTQEEIKRTLEAARKEIQDAMTVIVKTFVDNSDISQEVAKVFNGYPVELKPAMIEDKVENDLNQHFYAAIVEVLGNTLATSDGKVRDADVDGLYKDIEEKTIIAYKKRINEHFGGQYVTMESTLDREVYNHVFKVFDNYDYDTKRFYTTFLGLLKMIGNEWVQVKEEDFARTISESDLKNYRINLKKFDSEQTMLGRALPLYPAGVLGKIWYTTTSGTKRAVTTDNKNFFRDLYLNVYMGRPFEGMDLASSYEEGLKYYHVPYFDIDIKQVTRDRFARLCEAPVEQEDGCKEYEGENFIDIIDSNMWFNEQGKFVRYENGDKKIYDICDSEDSKCRDPCEEESHNHYKKSQEKFVHTCLMNEDAESLENCLANLKNKPNFYQTAKEEINQMHPIIALRTLQRFGFRTHKAYDNEAGMVLRKVECLDHWLENFMHKKFGETDQNVIKCDERLLAYLDLISQYVNANPGILNKGFSGISEECAGVYKGTDLVQSLGIKERKAPSKDFEPMYDIKRFRKHMEVSPFATWVKQHKTPFMVASQGKVYTPFGRMMTPGVNMLVPVQGGGNGLTQWTIHKLNKQAGSDHILGGKFIGEVFKVALNELSNRGKCLNDADLDKINKKIREIQKNEDELIKNIAYIEEYNKLMDICKDYSYDTLTINGLRKLVDRQDKLQSRNFAGETDLLKCLEDVYCLTNGEDKYDKLKL